MTKSLAIKIIQIIAVCLVIFFSIIMLKTISQYTSFEKNVGFLMFKQQVVNHPCWLTFFYIHIFSITFCLLAGLTQFSNRFLYENRSLHRLIGKIYVYNILIINVPACFILGIFSNGGLIGITGFLVQDILWAYLTIAAVTSIRKGNINRHKNYMISGYAVTTTAITFRIIKNLFYNEEYHDYELFYGITVWLSLFINLLIAYGLIMKKDNFLSLKAKVSNNHNKSNTHDHGK